MKLKIALILTIFIHFALTDQEDSFVTKHNNLLKWLNFFTDSDTPSEATEAPPLPTPAFQDANPNVQGSSSGRQPQSAIRNPTPTMNNPAPRQPQGLSFGVPVQHPSLRNPTMMNPVPTMPNMPPMGMNTGNRDGTSRDGQSALNAQSGNPGSGPQSLHAYYQPWTHQWHSVGYYNLQAPNSLVGDCSEEKLTELIGQKVSDLPKYGSLPGYRCFSNDWRESGSCIATSCPQARFCMTKGNKVKGRCRDPAGFYTKLCCIQN